MGSHSILGTFEAKLLRKSLVKYEMQYKAWEIEEKRRRRELLELEALRAKFQKEPLPSDFGALKCPCRCNKILIILDAISCLY